MAIERTKLASCPATARCASSLEGTSWTFAEVCVPRDKLYPELGAACSVAPTATPFTERLTGTVVFENGTMKRSVTIESSVLFSFSNACHGCQCGTMQSKLAIAGFAGASCNPACNGGTCACTVSRSKTFDFSESYQVASWQGNFAMSVAVDPLRRKIYWAVNQPSSPIYRAELDGASPANVSTRRQVYGIDLYACP